MKMQLIGLALTTALTTSLSAPGWAQEADAAQDNAKRLGVITVTAQKTEESIVDVPMSISAATGDMLESRGVTNIVDLIKVVPGFSAQQGNYGNPNFSIRGIGNQSDSVLSTPAVSVYIDQAPIAYTIMAQGAMFDLERVEVLKGPQGTLFGQNSTGGAINFIPKKPGDSFEAGINATAGRFETFNADGYVSFPVSDTLGVRLSGSVESSGGWQESVTRNDELGARDFIAGRAIIDWEPSESMRFSLNLNAWENNSELPAAQYVPGSFAPISGVNPDGSFNFQAAPALGVLVPLFAGVEATYASVNVTDSNSVADWTPGEDYSDDTSQFQIALRSEFDIGENMTLNSITNYVNIDGYNSIDADGLAEQVYTARTPIENTTFSQELRLSGFAGDKAKWMIGASYQNDEGESGNLISTNFSNNDAPFFGLFDATGALIPGSQPTGFATATVADPGPPPVLIPNSVDPSSPNWAGPGINSFAFRTPGAFLPNGLRQGIGSIEDQDITTIGIFGSLDYQVTDALTAQASVRWTESENDWQGCFTDLGNGFLSTFINGLPPFPNASAGECVTILDGGSFATGVFAPFTPGTAGLVEETLKEDNVSWRVGLDYETNSGTLVYGNITRGYKAGNFPRVPALTVEQQLPNGQEEVTAYEIGFKQSLDTAQINGAIFVYDYKDKQAVGTFLSPLLGVVPAGVSVPEAQVTGFELDGVWTPTNELTATFAMTYVDSEITSSLLNSPLGGTRPAIDPFGQVIDLDGLALPNTSEWNASGDLEYRFAATDSADAYVGASVQYRSEFFTQLTDNPALTVDDYTLLDLRAGVDFVDSGLRVELWGRNVTDEYYLTSINKLADAASAFTGRPATWGITLSYDY